MNRWKRMRLTFASRLLTGTGLTIARRSAIDTTVRELSLLDQYVQKSGGLADPRRIRAKRKIQYALEDIARSVNNIAVADVTEVTEAV